MPEQVTITAPGTQTTTVDPNQPAAAPQTVAAPQTTEAGTIPIELTPEQYQMAQQIAAAQSTLAPQPVAQPITQPVAVDPVAQAVEQEEKAQLSQTIAALQAGMEQQKQEFAQQLAAINQTVQPAEPPPAQGNVSAKEEIAALKESIPQQIAAVVNQVTERLDAKFGEVEQKRAQEAAAAERKAQMAEVRNQFIKNSPDCIPEFVQGNTAQEIAENLRLTIEVKQKIEADAIQAFLNTLKGSTEAQAESVSVPGLPLAATIQAANPAIGMVDARTSSAQDRTNALLARQAR